jgi:outer membrane receptor for ferrienterochelin and colicins
MKILMGMLLLCSQSVFGQQTFIGRITNEETHQPIQDVIITLNPSNKSANSDANGMVLIQGLLPGKFTLHCTSLGYKDRDMIIVFPQSGADTLIITMDPTIETVQDVVISSTRTNQLLKNLPLTVQVIDKEDIEEGTAESPGNIRELLTELSGTQMQQTSAVSGNVTIRLQGLDGRYTQLLKDGFPLFGGFSGSLSIMQVPPLDLKQVEVIKGAGSALYGGDAIAGIINLISRTPDTAKHLNAIINQTLKGGTDLSGFYSQRSHRTGITLLATTSRQDPVDVNNDGFTDIPWIRQGTIAPTFFWYPDDSTTLRFGLNLSTEERMGGDIYAVEHGTDSIHPFLQKNHTDRDYYQLSLVHKGKNQKTFSIKNSMGYFYRSIVLPGASFSGVQVSSFTEASYGFSSHEHQVITGMNFITDQFASAPPNKDLSYEHNTFGLFAQDDWKLNDKTTLESGFRADWVHSVYFLPRLSLLYRIAPRLTARMGGGLAYKLPTVFTDQDEESGFQQVYPISPSVQAEQSASANISFNYQGEIGNEIGFTIDQNFFYTRLLHSLIPQPDSLQKGWIYYINAPGPIASKGFETNASFSLDELSFYLGYTFIDARESYAMGQPYLPFTPPSRLVSSLMYEKEKSWKAGFEAFFTGTQYLDNGSNTPSFWTFDFMAEKEFGHFSVLVNIENFTDTRQSKFGPLFTGTIQNPVFNEIYAPLDGRVGNIALRYEL